MTSPSPRRPGPARRRQRSTRLWVAALLLLVGLACAAGATLSGSWVVATIASYVAVGLGAAAVRVVYLEMAESRREAARDRAQQAMDYLALTQVRTAEQASYVSDTSDRLAARQARIEALEKRLVTAAGELAEATRLADSERARAERAEADGEALRVRLDEADSRAAQAIVRVAELEQELDVVLAEWRSGTAAPRRKHA